MYQHRVVHAYRPLHRTDIGCHPVAQPENNAVVTESLAKVLPHHPRINLLVMDRVCGYRPSAEQNPLLRQLKYYSVDWLHAKGHTDACECNPYFVGRLSRRLGKMNTSVCKQTFSWFRKYAHTRNHMSPLRHRVMVLQFCKLHNTLVDRGDLQHLNPYAAIAPSRAPGGHYPCSKRPAPNMEQSVKKRPAAAAV